MNRRDDSVCLEINGNHVVYVLYLNLHLAKSVNFPYIERLLGHPVVSTYISILIGYLNNLKCIRNGFFGENK